MSSSIHGQSTDGPIVKPLEADEIEKEGVDEDEEEDEDFDFNPFLKGTPSPEASSSLSSEVEVLDGNSSKITANDEVPNYPVGDSEHGEEVVMQGPLDTTSQLEREIVENSFFTKPATDSDDEDAIWKRTRARYSLASFTLDELETFLQETDDEDDLQNVDDEAEYRKFLAAVLLGGGGDGGGQSAQAVENVEDEDEDNDADFEIELEELLESDGDDNKKDEDRKREYERNLRRPETRQNKRQKASAQYKQKLLEQTKRPLRPLLPILPNEGVASLTSVHGKALVPETTPCYPSYASEDFISGFTPQQIGQLHCLIHEHVQLLIQVFSLCILDGSKQEIASQVQGLIFDLLHKRDEGKAFRNVPYPSICFHPSYMTPSVIDGISIPNLQISLSQNIPRTENVFSRQSSSSQTTSSFWVPSVSGSVISVLDVAPLSLAGKYMDDVSNAAEEYRKQHLNSSSDTWNEKEPLFHLPNVPMPEANATRSTEICIPGQPTPKKTMAASIVENTKKQSIAFVPKGISKLIQRFLPLFNTALFPHKPPPAAVANRILFTDSEDELLALGMMELNTDWKAIQQRFLPCKSKHQIFVRQKNRCSSKALENPIKTVRRMKTSPLTAEEMEYIHEGLKVFKHDWTSVWRFVVPHRDPSLLPRQWRTAIGTQKSYKSDAAKREQRRKYESNRRRCKTEDLANWQEETQFESGGGEKNCGDDHMDDANEAYVHQAFLADWRPNASSILALPREQYMPHVHHYQYPHARSPFTHARNFPYSMQPNNQVFHPTPNSAKSNFPWPYRTRRTNGAHLVKLAPDLPPVNLPPTVRVISQAAFRSNPCGVPLKLPAPGVGTSGSGKENTVFQVQHENSTTDSLVKDKIANAYPEEPEESATLHEPCGTEERGAHSELQMHPLLFQDPKDGRSSYYPLSCRAGTPGSFTFFSANQPQLNLSLFHSPYQANQPVDCSNKSSKTKESASGSSGIDFHPLLQRADVENSDFAVPHPSSQQSGSHGKSTEFQTPLGVSQTKSPLNARASAAGSKSSGPVEKANELDLEIHLSSSSTKKKSSRSEDAGATNRPKSTISGNTIEKHRTSSPCHQHSESYPAVQSNMDPGGDLSAGPSNDESRCNMNDDIGDNSHPEIVMEQEELSDSDEETEEHVEFECEEMDDSDGDQSLDCDPTTAQVHDKDLPTEKATDGSDCAGQPLKPTSSGPGLPQTSADPGKDSPFLNLGLTNLGKDGSSNSWLSLDAGAPVDPPSPKYEECRISIANNLAASRSNRNCKKTTGSTKRVATEDMSQQLSLGPLFVPSLKKKPRKQVSRPNASFGTGMKTESSRYDQDKPG